MAPGIELSVEVHPQPGPQTGSIPVRIANRMENYSPAMRHHVESYCIQITTLFSYAIKNTINTYSCQGMMQTRHGGQNKRIKIAHLNAQSLKNRSRFLKAHEMARQHVYDILSFSETWFNSSVSNARVHLDGYKLFRLDRLRKIGGGVCAYA